jgi:hypothetical protein
MILMLPGDDLARLSPFTYVTLPELSLSECSNQAHSTQGIESSPISGGFTCALICCGCS